MKTPVYRIIKSITGKAQGYNVQKRSTFLGIEFWNYEQYESWGCSIVLFFESKEAAENYINTEIVNFKWLNS